MPWTIYWYILKDLLRLLVFVSAVMVLVVSFFLAIKPLADGLIGPLDLFRFLFYAGPTVLQYILPFAAAFASTMVFLRLAQDNEITACAASGMSYRVILTPVAVLGLSLTMGLFFLSHHVIPNFNRAVSQLARDDLISIMLVQLNQRQPFRFDRQIIYADDARDRPLTDAVLRTVEDPEAVERLIELSGVAVGLLNEEGMLRGEAIAQRASVLLNRDRDTDETWVNVRLREAVYFDRASGNIAAEGAVDLPASRLPTLFRDRVRFYSRSELQQLNQYPELFERVRDRAERLAHVISGEKLLIELHEKLRAQDQPTPLVLRGMLPGETFHLISPRVEASPNSQVLYLHADDQQRVTVTLWAHETLRRRYESPRAELTVVHDGFSDEPMLDLTLHAARVTDVAGSAPPTQVPQLRLSPLYWHESMLLPASLKQPHPNLQDKQLWDTQALLHMAASAPFDQSSAVAAAARALHLERRSLAHNIISQLHERAASAIACMLLILVGALLSMNLKGQMPLIVFFYTVILALASICLTATGQNMAKGIDHPLWFTLPILWLGNMLMAIIVGWLYCRVARN